jgi:hypothetical protein
MENYYLQFRSRRDETNPFRQKSFALFHNSGANGSTSNARLIINKNGGGGGVSNNNNNSKKSSSSSDQVLIKKKNANEIHRTTSTEVLSLGKSRDEDDDDDDDDDYDDNHYEYDEENNGNSLRVLRNFNFNSHQTVETLIRNRTSKLSSINSRSNYSELDGGVGGIILRSVKTPAATAPEQLARRAPFRTSDNDVRYIGRSDVDPVVFLNGTSQHHQNMFDTSPRYSHHYQQQNDYLQRNRTGLAMAGSASGSHNSSSYMTNSQHSQLSIKQSARQPRGGHHSRPKTVSEFFMRPVVKADEIIESEPAGPLVTGAVVDLAAINVARHNATATLAIKKARRLQSARLKEAVVNAPVQVPPDQESDADNARSRVISDVDMKKFKNLEQFYIKKMHEFGFEDLSYQSTNRMLSRSEPGHVAEISEKKVPSEAVAKSSLTKNAVKNVSIKDISFKRPFEEQFTKTEESSRKSEEPLKRSGEPLQKIEEPLNMIKEEPGMRQLNEYGLIFI